MRVTRLILLVFPLAFGGCTFSSSDPPAPKNNTTVVVPSSSTVVCPSGTSPPCQ